MQQQQQQPPLFERCISTAGHLENCAVQTRTLLKLTQQMNKCTVSPHEASECPKMSVCVCVYDCNDTYEHRLLVPISLLFGTNVISTPPFSLLLPKTQDNAVQPPNWVSLKRFIGMLLNILTFF